MATKRFSPRDTVSEIRSRLVAVTVYFACSHDHMHASALVTVRHSDVRFGRNIDKM
jgi:hypothetical protein